MPSIHQVNHPGREQYITYRGHRRHPDEYYFFPGSRTQGVRLWNRTMLGGRRNLHKRKFIEHSGAYVEELNHFQSNKNTLRFWGEFEGHSRFELLEAADAVPYWENPCALHRPFFCLQGMQDQNTDPWVFGESWYYAICQKARLRNIEPGDIVLFGSEFGDAFYMDTLLVIQDSVEARWEVFEPAYRESTLLHLGVSEHQKGTFPVHRALKHADSASLFSFVPAHLPESRLRSRPRIDTIALGLKKPGARTGAFSRQLFPYEQIDLIWNTIATQVLHQGLVLATDFEAPVELAELP
jgi:hypothetical protein